MEIRLIGDSHDVIGFGLAWMVVTLTDLLKR